MSHYGIQKQDNDNNVHTSTYRQIHYEHQWSLGLMVSFPHGL